MRKINRIEILSTGHIQVLEKEVHELKGGGTIEGKNHRFVISPEDDKSACGEGLKLIDKIQKKLDTAGK